MKTLRRRLSDRYCSMLRHYVAKSQESVLARANGLGRAAMAGGLGLLDMARIHQAAMSLLLHESGVTTARGTIMRASECFLMEALSPFEMTYRGFREANLQLQRLIEDVKKKNISLRLEVNKRQQTEKILRNRELRMHELLVEAKWMEENLRRYSDQILHTQEAERLRISRELHDDIGQALTAASVALQGLSDTARPGRAALLADARELLQDAMVKVHDFASDLRPSVLDELGLLPALRSYLDRTAKRTGLHVWFRAARDAELLPADEKITLFRVAQECLTNVAKHAHARSVRVTISRTGNCVRMVVADDGRSFRNQDADGATPKPRLGLLGMRERVRLVNGSFEIRAQPEKGTQVKVTIPLRRAERTRGIRKQIQAMCIPDIGSVR